MVSYALAMATSEGPGAALRAYRRQAQLSQEELAARAGISVRALRDIEGGRVREPRGATLRLLMAALDLDRAARDALVPWTPVVGPVIAQLPAAVPDFTGRDGLVTALTEQLGAPASAAPGPRVVVLCGPAGVGKSALAVHVAHRLRPAFGDGQLFAELRGASSRPAEPGEVLAGFLRSLGVARSALVSGIDELAALLRSRLAGRRVLLLLDDAGPAAQIRPLLPGGADGVVLVTTRGRLADLEAASFVSLAVLDQPGATALFGRVAGPDRTAADPSATRRILVACRGLPLAIRIAGARVAAWPERGLDQLADLLADEQGRLDQLSVGDLEVRASIALSYEALDSEARRTFRLLGALGVPEVPLWAMPALLDRADGVAMALVDQLTEVHLVEIAPRSDAGPHVRFHDLVRLYAQERARVEDGDQVRAAVARAAGAWLALVDAAQPRLPGGLTRTAVGAAARWPMPAAVVNAARHGPDAWFATERAALIALIDRCVTTGLDELAWDLAGGLTRFLELRGHYAELTRVAELGLVAARRQGDVAAESFLLRVQGDLHADLDRYDQAADCLQQALALARAAGNERQAAWAERSLSTVRRVQGRGTEAAALLDDAVVTLERAGDAVGVGECHYGLGAIAREHGRFDDALHHYDVALAIFRAMDDRFNESLVLTSSARVHQLRNATGPAADALERALRLCADIDHPGGVAWASTYLGDLWVAAGRPEAAEPLLTDALTLARQLGDRYCEAVTLHTLGRLRLETGSPLVAEGLVRHSIVLADQYDLPLHQGRSLITLGDVQLRGGAVAEAGESWRAAQRLLSQHGFPEAADAEHRLLTRN